ncbi:MAG: ABC transporter permease [Vicinamibacterales bacterium]
MPIHDQGYRRYAGERRRPGGAWRVIAQSAIRTQLSRRGFAALLLLAWLPFLVRAVMIYGAINLPQARFLAPTVTTFRDFLGFQEIFLFFVSVYAGAGLIANDRRANALPIYLSRPLTRLEYVGGKLASLVCFLLLVTWVPALALLLVQVVFAGNLDFVVTHWRLVPAITLFAWVQALTVAMAVLALSSLSTSGRYVGVLYAALLFFTQAMTMVLRAVTGHSRLAWLSVANSLEQLGHAAFGTRPQYDAPLIACLGMVVLVVVVSTVVLERRIRGVEVIA